LGNLIERLQQRATEGKSVTVSKALDLLEKGADAPFSVMVAATGIREAFRGKTVSFCGISNVKSGQFGEDCAFCARSIHHRIDIPTYPFKTPGRIAAEARAAGLERHHHNLETSRSDFPRICTTHDYEEDLATVRAAKAAGRIGR